MSDESQKQKHGNLIAYDVWAFLLEQKSVKLVPWVVDPASPKHDPIKVAKMEGYHEALGMVEDLMVHKAALLRAAAADTPLKPEPPPNRDTTRGEFPEPPPNRETREGDQPPPPNRDTTQGRVP